MKTILCNGCFDVLHPGHLHMLKQASNIGNRLIVAVNSDNYLRELKHRNPIVKQKLRRQMLQATIYVEHTHVFRTEERLKEIIEDHRVDIIVKGADWAGKKITGSDIAQVVFVPLLEGWSTTGIIEKIRGGNCSVCGSDSR